MGENLTGLFLKIMDFLKKGVVTQYPLIYLDKNQGYASSNR